MLFRVDFPEINVAAVTTVTVLLVNFLRRALSISIATEKLNSETRAAQFFTKTFFRGGRNLRNIHLLYLAFDFF